MDDGSPDSALVARAASGDRAAFGVLVDRHRSGVESLCRRVLHDPQYAEDVLQESVLRAWLSLHTLRDADRFGAWLGAIAVHISRAELRYRRPDVWSLDAVLGGGVVREPTDDAPGAHSLVERAEISDRVQRAVAELPKGQRAAVGLFYLVGLSHAESAALLGIDVNALKARLHKARNHLRRTLAHVWSEEHMTAEPAYVDVEVEDVRAVPVEPSDVHASQLPAERRVVLLADKPSDRVLPIWVGHFEGDTISILLVGAESQRPLTMPFAASLLKAAGGRLTEVRITRLVGDTYFAEVLVETRGSTQTVDARPSDAIALALEIGAPIRVAGGLMHEAAIPRAELNRRTSPESRSARANADEVRSLVTRPWTHPGSF